MRTEAEVRDMFKRFGDLSEDAIVGDAEVVYEVLEWVLFTDRPDNQVTDYLPYPD